jgi:hypothetical protein
MQDPLTDELASRSPLQVPASCSAALQLAGLCVVPDRDIFFTQSQRRADKPDSRSAEADRLHDRITEKLQHLTRACTPPPHLPSVEDGGELFPKWPSAADVKDVRRPSAPSEA